MKIIQLETWERKEHYLFFKNFDYPQFNVCANLDITKWYRFIKEWNYPFYLSMIYQTMRIANQVTEFRYRIRQTEVVEHEIVHPSFTVMTTGGLFNYCTAQYAVDLNDFLENARKQSELAQHEMGLQTGSHRDDLIYITCLPWVSFTGMTHPIHMHPADSIPRISWGKFFEEKGHILLPFSVQAHHALVDGAHVGRFYQLIQEALNQIVA